MPTLPVPATLNGNGTVPEAKRPVTDPTREYLAGGAKGYGYGTATGPRVLPADFDDVCRQHGTMQVYEWMLCDGAVAAALNKITQGVLAGGVKLRPTKEAPAGGKPDADAARAGEIAGWCQWNLDRLDVPLPDVLEEWLDALAFGSVLSEVIWDDELVEGKRALKAIKPKPWWSYRYVVDRYGEIMWIEQADRYTGVPAAPGGRIARDHVAVFTWAGRRGDPRGQSLLRPAYLPWSDKRQAKIDYLKYLKRFASPSVAATLPSNPQPMIGADGQGVNLYQWVGERLEAFVNGYWVVLPHESTIQFLQASGNGEAFLAGIRDYNSDIYTAILGSARSTMEAEHGSRADSETSQDDVGGLNRFVAGKLSRCLQWDVLYPLVLENWGKEVADAFTPTVDVGAVEHQDEAALAGAYGPIGYKLHPKHLPAIDAKLGLDPRTEADVAEEEARAKEAFREQQQAATAAGPGGGGAPDRGGVPASGPKPKPGGTPKPDGKPAEFAYDDSATLAGPFHDADVVAARALLSAAFPSAAAYKRWQAGQTDKDDRLAILGWIADDAKARLSLQGEALRRELAASPAVAFAGPFEVVRGWRDSMASLLRRAYLAGTLALVGPGELSDRDWDTLRGANNAQVAYLDGFAGDVLSGAQLTDGTLASRAGLYGQSVWSVAHAVERDKAMASGATLERRVHRGPDRPCSECATERAKGWQPIGSLKPIGACLCMTGCHCHFEFKGGPA